jgi:hypothetical protein
MKIQAKKFVVISVNSFKIIELIVTQRETRKTFTNISDLIFFCVALFKKLPDNINNIQIRKEI